MESEAEAQEHVYECPSDPNIGMRIVHMDQSNGFGGTIHGSMWCWNHGRWESIPQEWRDKERELRTSILREFKVWQDNQSANMQTLLPFPVALVDLVSAYTTHRSLLPVVWTDRSTVFRLIDTLEAVHDMKEKH